CGNSLFGTTPALIAKGIPDEAFKPIEGDDKKIVSLLRQRNQKELVGQMSLFADFGNDPAIYYKGLAKEAFKLETIDDRSIAGILNKQEQYEKLITSDSYCGTRLLADAWCSAFVWKKTKQSPLPVTEDIFRRLAINPLLVPAST